MAEIDSLEISIQSNIDKVNKNMDLLIKKMSIVAQGISAIGSNKGLDEFIKSTKNASESMGNIGKKVEQSVKPIEGQMQKLAKSFEQVGEPFKDLGKGFKVSGGVVDIQKSIQKYENELERTKLKEQELSAGGKTNTEGYKTAVARVIEYRNVVESLKEQLKSVKALEAAKVEIPVKDLSVEEFTTRIRKQIEQSLDGLRIENPISIGDMSHEQFQIFKTLNEEAKDARNSLSVADEELEEIGKTAANTGNIIRNSAQSFKYSASAMEAVFGKEYATIENFQQMAEKFNVKSGGQLGAALSDSFSNEEAKAQSLKEKFSGLVVPEIKEDNLKRLQSALKRTEEEIDRLRAKLSNEITMGRMTDSVDDKKFAKLSEQIALAEKRSEALRAKIAEVGNGGENRKVESLSRSFSKVSSAGQRLSKALTGVVNSLRNFAKGVVSVFSRIGKLAKSMLLLGNATKKSNGGFNVGLKTILKYGFGIRSLYVLVNKLRSAIKEGMKNLIQYSDQTNQSVSMLSSSMSQFKNASAAAFAPILNAIAPALNSLIQLFIRATNAINQFFSALTGHGTWIRAKYVYEDVADKISGAADAAKGALQPFDKLNNLTTQKGAGAGGIDPSDMFETVPVEDKFKKLADKIKDIMSKLFAPLKEAWRREGKFVMDSWKYALNEIWKMIKDIGRDFLTVWQQEKTIKIFEDILHIIGDIGLAIGHLARNFREAWNENETGLHILENIRDIIGVIIHNIRLAADFTVEWADKLNFSPILQAIERFTKSLIPVADALSGVLMDFYTMVLLPLAKWTIEKGLPELLDVFTAFNEKVDWKKLRDNLAEFWKHLEPFAETVGEGLIIFIERVSDLVANFNSETFVNFLHAVEDWMDSVAPEDVADGIEKLAKAFIALKVALLALSGFTKIAIIINTVISAFGKMGVAISKIWGILKNFGSGIKSILTTLSQGLQGIHGVTLGLSNAFMMLNPGMLGELSLRFDNFIAGTWLDPNEWTGLPRIIIDAISDTLYAIVDDLVDFSTTIDLFESAAYFFEQAKKSFEEQDWAGLARNIIDGIAGGLLGAISFFTQPIQNIFKTIWQGLCDVFGIHSPATTMVPVGQNILLGVIQGFNEKIGEFTTAIQTWFDSYVSPWFTKEKWTNLYSSIKTTLIEVWNNTVAQWKNGISSWWNTNVLPWFAYEKWNGMLSKIPQSFVNAFNKVKQIVSNSMQEVYNKVSGIIRQISSTLSSIASAIRNVSSGFSGIKIPSASKQSASRIKGYKAGGFPEDGWFRASHGEIMGQFDNGQSVVANNNQITDGIEQAAYRGFMRALQSSGTGTSNVNVILEGDAAQFFRYTKEEYNKEASRKGVTSRDPVFA